jgi:hypothetical protein
MIGFGRLMAVLAVMAALGYGLLCLVLASRKRELLKRAWAEGDSGALDLDAYVEAGMADWQQSLPRRLLWLVALVPYAVVGALIYFGN